MVAGEKNGFCLGSWQGKLGEKKNAPRLVKQKLSVRHHKFYKGRLMREVL